MYLLQREYLPHSRSDRMLVDQQVINLPFYDTSFIELETSFSSAISFLVGRSLWFHILSPVDQLIACEILLYVIYSDKPSPLNASRTNNISYWSSEYYHLDTI